MAPTHPTSVFKPPTPPFTLTKADIQRIHGLVNRFLPSGGYDNEYIADTIVLDAWLKEVPVVSVAHIRHKCISAYRQLQREKKRNEELSRIRQQTMVSPQQNLESQSNSDAPVTQTAFGDIDRKELIEQAVGCLTNFERKLVWMRYYESLSLAEICSLTSLSRENIQRALQVAIYKMQVHMTS